MEFLNSLQELWNTYSPLIIGAVVALGSFAGVIFVVWGKVQPLFAKIADLKNDIKDNKISDVSASLQTLDLETKITDLKEKLNNPLISDEGKLAYTKQLTQLLEIKAKIDVGLVTVEETTNKYL